MNNVYKKALMLKAESAYFRAACSYVLLKYEQFGKTKNITLSPLTSFLNNEQKFFIVLSDGANNFCVYPLPQNGTNTVNISENREFCAEKGFCAAIFSVKRDDDDFYTCESCFFGYTDNKLPDLSELKNNLLQTINLQVLNQTPNSTSINEKDATKPLITPTLNDYTANQTEAKGRQSQQYNDEAIATENYFLKENFYNGNIALTDFNIRNTQEETTQFKENNYELLHTQTSCDKANGQKRTNTQTNNYNPPRDETPESACYIKNSLPEFYRTIKDKIEELFLKSPPIGSLSQLIPDSKWIKSTYKNSGYYVVGIIFANNIPQYIVYGVPGENTIKPKGFQKYTVFIPESFFCLNKGYWCMFQNAQTGERENPD